ncbi:zinc finger protein castor homolog 1 isoform X1 [Diorhabda carinulata]|uniref:zinc finger protein castor homolog 1 isoform X1 n=1 Tax=Diorhabda carinulata TaxID=1163345 RepID=UPI0025A00D99|nr:zinc finger protein castor homolog 1 isoform X1 [Diorhabda carinulata]
MLSTMATVTSGLISPNSFGLNSDTIKMATDNVDNYSRYHDQEPFDSNANTSDSDQDNYVASPKNELPKRNKRKNFKPRCSNTTYFDNNEALNLSEFNDNNNVNNNVRRRKTLSTRKLVIDSRFSPMDLSKNNDSETNSDSDSNENYPNSDYEANDNSSENDSKIPPSFSIHNLSKPHVPDFTQNPPHLSQEQVIEMRQYAMNTMRELLGIYGLTSEVAESISRQLPMAAFSTGKIFENFTLNPPPKKEGTPPSQPPTPPSTPLSPKSSDNTQKLSNIPTTPTLTYPTSQSSQRLPQLTPITCQSTPLNLIGKKPPHQISKNGSLSHSPDMLYTSAEIEAIRKVNEEVNNAEKISSSGRGIFPTNYLPFSQLTKTESSSPPPLDPNPLNAMMAQSLAPTTPREPLASNQLLNKTTSQMDYSKYVKKFSSSLECGSTYCKDLNYREHFHCLDCNSRVFIKKEEMIRHFKWHKKRDESLQHGFMRYSPLDDCGDKFANCTHNKKQTHYHCIKEGCDKVYISTSDVQMHANYHRKDSAIIQEGFQRYRATEECGASYCAFFGQRTTHFHCRRSGCRFTFKNKSDMEKHKSYHIKDEQLSRDGFKKFMKNESCPFDNCRFSKVCNHIHCIRPQCSYVLHSSGQLFSHKRKHERKDSELAYRKYKLAQSMLKTLTDGNVAPPINFPRDYEAQIDSLNLSMYNQSNMSNTESLSERNSPVSYEESESFSAIDLSANESNFGQEDAVSFNSDDFWRKYCQFVPENQCPNDKCEFMYADHFHCFVENCEMAFNSKESAREHARNHEQQETITDNYFTTVTVQNGGCEENCVYQDKEKHYHCNWESCREVILPMDKPFRRLEHYKMHEYSKKLSLTKDPLTMTHLSSSIDGMFCRKRGRPPKNRVIEVWNDYNHPMGTQNLMDSPQAIFTSFKLPKPSAAPSSSKETEHPDSNDDRSSTHSPTPQDYSLQGFDIFNENTKCPDNLCPYLGATHFHCVQNRCLYVTNKEDSLLLHAKDFHDNVDILDGFEFYDRNVDCRLSNCPSNKINRHFHCTRPNCNYSFVQYSAMAIHNQIHTEDAIQSNQPKAEIRVKSEAQLTEQKPEIADGHFKAMNLSQSADSNKVSVVKASGTFYPLSTLTTEIQKLPEYKTTVSEPSKLNESIPQAAGSNTLYGPELSCSRPFCKLKRKYHYHCNACNQALSELDKLLSHIAKHSSGALNSQSQEEFSPQSFSPPSPQTPTTSTPSKPSTESKITVAPLQSLQNPQINQQKESHETYLPPTFDAYNHFSNFPANLQFAIMSQQQQIQNPFLQQSIYQNSQLMFQHAQLMQSPLLTPQSPYPSENLTSPLAAMAANLNKRSMSPHDISPEAKKARIQNSMRILKDEPVPEGYLRFRFNEDCQYQHCGYREHQTHFHCQRQDCGYSFCDKTRFVQHTARHERLDTLMGGDFQQYRANVPCGRVDCAYTANLGATQNKASHFHCLKCDFVCTDTNKVVAHRRQHQKLDSIQAAGFEKFTPSQICRVPNCQHSGKQTHYHCLQCQYAVLGLAQMSAHKYRHME